MPFFYVLKNKKKERNFSITPGNFSSCPRRRASRLWVRLDSRLRGNDGNSQLLKNRLFCPELLRSYKRTS